MFFFKGSIAEAQEWEYKLIEVQDWLTDKDILLSSHLEQGLTMDDLPDESQVSEGQGSLGGSSRKSFFGAR